MPVHFPDGLFDDDDEEELALQIFSKLRANRVLRENSKRVDQITPWFAADDSAVRHVVEELANCDDADLAKSSTRRVYLTEEFLDNPDIGYTTFGDGS